MTEPLSEAIAGTVLSTAYGLARRHKLVVGDQIFCWSCGQRPALMPSLHCPACLADAWRRLNVSSPQCVNRDQSPEDVEACQ